MWEAAKPIESMSINRVQNSQIHAHTQQNNNNSSRKTHKLWKVKDKSMEKLPKNCADVMTDRVATSKSKWTYATTERSSIRNDCRTKRKKKTKHFWKSSQRKMPNAFMPIESTGNHQAIRVAQQFSSQHF